MKIIHYTDVDDYIAKAPLETQEMAKALRAIIKANAPLAEEKISYQMPYYGYKGRLIYFAAYKDYIGLYVMTPAMQALEHEVQEYRTSKSTLRFPVGKPLPTVLIKKIIKTQLAVNEQN